MGRDSSGASTHNVPMRCLAVLLAVAAACSTLPPGPRAPDGDVAQAIDTAWGAHFAAVRRGDVDAAVALYCDDVVYALTDRPELRGKPALTAMERLGIASSTLGEVTHRSEALTVDNGTAHELGSVRGDVAVGTAPARNVAFTYVAVWRRGDDGTWRIAHLAGHFPGEALATGATTTASGDVDLRPRFTAYGLPPRGQGARPTCSIFATTAVAEFAFARATGTGTRLSAEFCNWAANAATGRSDDGDFFHCALQGYERFGLCSDALWPYGTVFPAGATPPPDALVDAGRRAATAGASVRVRWLRPIDGTRGLSPAQFADVLATLRAGWPVAVGAAHRRVLVGWRGDASAPGGGTFLTLDSGHGVFAELGADIVQAETCDAFTITTPDR